MSATICSHKLYTQNTKAPGKDDWAPFDSVMKLEILWVLECGGTRNDICLQFLCPSSILLLTEVAKRKQGRESEVRITGSTCLLFQLCTPTFSQNENFMENPKKNYYQGQSTNCMPLSSGQIYSVPLQLYPSFQSEVIICATCSVGVQSTC